MVCGVGVDKAQRGTDPDTVGFCDEEQIAPIR